MMMREQLVNTGGIGISGFFGRRGANTMKQVAKAVTGYGKNQNATNAQHARQFGHHVVGIGNMLNDRIGINRAENTIGIGQSVPIGKLHVAPIHPAVARSRQFAGSDVAAIDAGLFAKHGFSEHAIAAAKIQHRRWKRNC